MDAVAPDIYIKLQDAFISHANDNKFVLLVLSLIEHFCDAVWEDIFIYIDILTIDQQNNVHADLQDGETVTATINCSKAVVVVLRLWCL